MGWVGGRDVWRHAGFCFEIRGRLLNVRCTGYAVGLDRYDRRVGCMSERAVGCGLRLVLSMSNSIWLL